VRARYAVIVEGMDDLKKSSGQNSQVAEEQEIVKRFTNVFGRNMTALERRIFFLCPMPSEEDDSLQQNPARPAG
jgi:hypothetical protein